MFNNKTLLLFVIGIVLLIQQIYADEYHTNIYRRLKKIKRSFNDNGDEDNRDILIPKPSQAALMARYVVHKSNWVSLSTLSTLPNVMGYPFVNIMSMSDGLVENGTGVPYLYMPSIDFSAIDISKDNRCSIMVTLAEGDYCKNENLDPEDPRCAHIILSGRLVKVPNDTDEYAYAKNALFTRHPVMKTWPASHRFFVAKINLVQIAVLDTFGGPKYVSTKDYFAANPENKTYRELFGTNRLNNLKMYDEPSDILFDNVEVVDIQIQRV